MRSNRRVDTGPELRLRSAVHRLGLRFRKDHPVETGERRVRPDIVFTRARVCVFCDGCFWHGCPQHATKPRTNAEFWERKLARNVERDRQVDRALAAAGWTVVRVWEHEDPASAAARIATVVSAATGRLPAPG
ncbi:MAG: very short patch repair endonuclease [Solirubrobacterales bacterium]|nr:very short patch repair endonuclease [Solirubrobacterales bacterium]